MSKHSSYILSFANGQKDTILRAGKAPQKSLPKKLRTTIGVARNNPLKNYGIFP